MSGTHVSRTGRVDRGFTTIDLAVTLAVLGVLLTFGITTVDTSAWSLDAAAAQVSQRMRVARSLAVLRQHDVIVTVDVSKRAIVVHEDANNNGDRDDGERVVSYPLEKGTTFTRGAAPAHAGFSGGAVTFSDERVVFRRNGSASEEGAVYVGRGSDDARPKVVVVTRATGYAETWKYDGHRWVKP